MTNSCSPTQPGGYPSDCEIVDGYRTLARERQGNTMDVSEVVLDKASKIRLLLLDVDGVLTDGTLLYSSSGEEVKAFNAQDGFGITLLHQAGIETGIITARNSDMVRRRAEELKMKHIYQGVRKKNQALKEILHVTGIKPFAVAYMGDDWLDLTLLQQVGLAISPANGADELKSTVHYITPRTGGNGAVRDTCNLLLSSQGVLQKLFQEYLLG